MRTLNLLNLWKINKTTGTPLLGTNEILEDLSFMSDYLLNAARFDRNFVMRHGFLCPLWNLQYEDTEQKVLDTWKEDVDNFFIKHSKDFSRLWAGLLKEYDPLENFDRNEEYTDTNSGTDTRKVNVGRQEVENDYGAREVTDETVRAGFDSAGYVADRKNTTNDGRHLDTTTSGAREDIDALTHGHVVKHTGRLHGNIGVTTSQQMLESEYVLRIKYNFYNTIWLMLIKELCTYHDGGINAFGFADCDNEIYKEVKQESEADTMEAYVTQLTNGAQITITDSTHGTTTAVITNGINGTNGKDGKDGKDGLTPTFEINTEGHLLQGYEEE